MHEALNSSDQLSPSFEDLCNHAVMFHAWKKTQRYISRYNWYADFLALDLFAIQLETELRRWHTLLQQHGTHVFAPAEMRVVPAPKSARWKIAPHWSPAFPEELRLRPLAHLHLRDQVLGTAAMMCLANEVESAQGDCAMPLVDAQHCGVASYGNRLHCQWMSGRAAFGWANRNSYRDYYTDYRRFVTRPTEVVSQLVSSGQSKPADTYIVHVDIRQFYDHVDRGELITKLRTLDPGSANSHPHFWEALGHLMSWRWHVDDIPLLQSLDMPISDRGLPQGLVASGFFANAYLIAFDNLLSSGCGKRQHGSQWRLLDYCRYVDDMRLVVHGNGLGPSEITTGVLTWLKASLSSTAPGLMFNDDKFVVQRADRAPGNSRVAATMEHVQSQLSGPLDFQTGEAVLNILQGLLPLAEQAARESADQVSPTYDGDSGLPVSALFRTELDVRPDTLERFAANRWRTTFRRIRQYSHRTGTATSPSPATRALDEQAALFARRLIRRWVENPSSTQLLHVAMDLLPSPDHLSMVLSLLEPYLRTTSNTPESRVCQYVVADLLRHGATDTGYVKEPAQLPASSRPTEYRKLLLELAKRLVQKPSGVPWYVLQQALVFAASQDVALTLSRSVRTKLRAALESHLSLHHLMRIGVPERVTDGSHFGALLVLSHRVQRRTPRLAKQVSQLVRRCSTTAGQQILEAIAAADRPLALALHRLSKAPDTNPLWAGPHARLLHLQMSSEGPLDALPTKSNIPLYQAFKSHPNPFRQEIGALHLLLAILRAFPRGREWGHPLTPQTLLVRCADWRRLHDPSSPAHDDFLCITINEDPSVLTHPIYSLQKDLPRPERFRLMLGRVLRAAIIGDIDYTLLRTTAAPSQPALDGSYQSIGSTWFSRQYGLANANECLGGPATPISPWLSELLDTLLHWRGRHRLERTFKLTDVESRRKLTALSKRQLADLNRTFGRASDMPIYHIDVAYQLKKPPEMTVVIAQTVLPRMSDFLGDVTLSDPTYRARHSHHLSTVAKLVEQMMSARTSFLRPNQVDLIVLPELSVHPDDTKILERLADRTHAMVLCGMTFQVRPDDNKLVNAARWLIPNRTARGRTFIRLDQGKEHMTRDEGKLGIVPSRPCQFIIRGNAGSRSWRLSSAICYDATDLRLAADLCNRTDLFLVPAMNRDVGTFDNMVAALHYHMYQHIVLANTGEFGGSTAQAPYRDQFKRLLVHSHGGEQIAISTFDVDLRACKPPLSLTDGVPLSKGARPTMKYPPANFDLRLRRADG